MVRRKTEINNTEVSINREKQKKEVRQYVASKASLYKKIDLMDLFRLYESKTVNLRDLAVDGTMLLKGGFEEMYPGLQPKDVRLFLYRSRINFMLDYKHFINLLVSPTVFAEFKGVSRQAISEQMESGKFDMVEISGKKFVLPDVEELLDFNKFLMEKELKKEKRTEGNDDRNYKMLMKVYEREYGGSVVRDDSVREWVEYVGIVASLEDRGDACADRNKIEMTNAYAAYCKWAKCEDYEPVRGGGVYVAGRGKKSTPVSRNEFSRRIGNMGFVKFQSDFRGFYFYFKDTEHLIGSYWTNLKRQNLKRVAREEYIEPGSVGSVDSFEEYERMVKERNRADLK